MDYYPEIGRSGGRGGEWATLISLHEKKKKKGIPAAKKKKGGKNPLRDGSWENPSSPMKTRKKTTK